MNKKETLYLIKHPSKSMYVKTDGKITTLEDGVKDALAFDKEVAKDIIKESGIDLVYVKVSSITGVEARKEFVK